MLSKRAKYALNALVELARARSEGPLSAAAIAERAHVPGKFLEAILLDLRHAGIISSTRGRTGGHRLRVAPEEVDMASVLRLFDGAIGLVPCVTHNYYERCEECLDEATCGIRDVFAQIRAASVELLKSATLADVLVREKRLTRSRARRRTKIPLNR
jgi:Rrf2 family protein